MRQPEDEKGNPTNPTGDPTTKPTAFTDGNNYANYFVRELYLGFDWGAFSKQYAGLYLYCAVLNGTSAAPFICIAPRKGKGGKAVYYQVHGLMATRCPTNGVVKLEGDGELAGLEAYIVADWETVWALPASKTGLKDGKILFEAKIRTDYAQNLCNSPRIKDFVTLKSKMDNFYNTISNEFSGLKEANPGSFSTITEVDDAKKFADAIRDNANAAIILKGDIRKGKHDYASSTYGGRSLFNIPKGKSIKIIGNGHRIYEYGSGMAMHSDGNGRKEADFQTGDINIYEAVFTDSDGSIHTPAQSEVYEADSWEEVCIDGIIYEAQGIKVPEALQAKLADIDYDNVYIWLLVSWTRTLHKATKYDKGVIYFEGKSLNGLSGSNDYDPNLRGKKGYKISDIVHKPTFFLVNTTVDNDGIVIKGGKISCPESFPSLWQCKADHLVNVEEGATLIVEDTVFSGGKSSCVRNSGTLLLNGCEITNPVRHGVYTTGKACIEGCTFHDIRNEGVYQVVEDNYRERWKPDAPEGNWPCMSVTGNTFRNIGHYGLNNFAVRNECVAYIADNEIIDANYGGIWTGNNSNNIMEFNGKDAEGNKISYAQKGKAFLPAFRGLVEYNHIYFTDAWVERRKLLGFQDSGGIYVAPNNGRAVVRFNRLERCGGRHMNKAIYGDDGPYNAEVYCNIVSGTENDYDIDFRDMSAEPSSRQHAKISGTYVNTCNTISLNYCEGFVRIKDNHNDPIPEAEREQLKCHFKDNVVLGVKGESNDSTAPTKSDIAYKEGNADEVATSDSDLAKVLNNFIWEKIRNHNKNQGK